MRAKETEAQRVRFKGPKKTGKRISKKSIPQKIFLYSYGRIRAYFKIYKLLNRNYTVDQNLRGMKVMMTSVKRYLNF